MKTVGELELAQRRELRQEMGLDYDPLQDIKTRLARLDSEVAKLEGHVNEL